VNEKESKIYNKLYNFFNINWKTVGIIYYLVLKKKTILKKSLIFKQPHVYFSSKIIVKLGKIKYNMIEPKKN